MQKRSLSFILVLFAALWFSKLNAQTVYVTDAGKKYHAKNCSTVKTGKKGIEFSDAVKQGYEPCKICKSDAVKPAEATSPGKKDKPKSGK